MRLLFRGKDKVSEKMLKQFGFALVVGILSITSLEAYDWPIKEDTVQHVLTSVMGECRDDGLIVDSIDHFHRGIDISAPCSTKVYTIEGDTCYIDIDTVSPIVIRGINIGHFRYYHMVIRGVIDDTSWVGPDSFFAKADGQNHVHLQESDVVLRHPGDLNDVHWLNPLRSGGISPFVDTAHSAYPVIRNAPDSIKFWRQGTNNTIPRDSLWGRVDISVDVRTPWIDSLGRGYDGGATGNMGVYKVFGYLFSEKDTLSLDTLAKFQYQKYDTCPKDQNVEYAYAPGSYTSRHIYFITNNPFDTLNPQNYYWNTKQKLGAPDSVDADSIENAKFKDGFYWVKVIAADIKNNADTDFQIPKSKPQIPNNIPNLKISKIVFYFKNFYLTRDNI